FLFFQTPPTPHSYTLSLHDALPISIGSIISSNTIPGSCAASSERERACARGAALGSRISSRNPELQQGTVAVIPALIRSCPGFKDRKSTRLNSSHVEISYAVFCLKK